MTELNPAGDGQYIIPSSLPARSQQVLRALGEHTLRSIEIAHALDLKQGDVSPYLRRLVAEGWVERVSRGMYRRNRDVSMFGAPGTCACRCCDHTTGSPRKF